MKKKMTSADGKPPRHLAALESELLHDLMPLVEHMGVTAYDDGDARVPGFITIRTQGAAWVIDVKDPDSGNSFRIVDQTLDKALQSVALLLACDEAPWSPDAFLKRPSGKRTPK